MDSSQHAPNPPSMPARRPSMLAVVAWVSFLALGGALVFGFAASMPGFLEGTKAAACKPMDGDTRLDEPPQVTWQDLDGNPVSLADFRGKFVVLNFWATWCEPCLREWPELDKLGQRLAERDDVVILAVSIDADKPEIRAFVERTALQGSRVKVLHDSSTEGHKRFGSEKIPDTYFIDKNGKVISKFVNVRLWGGPQAQLCVESQADAS